MPDPASIETDRTARPQSADADPVAPVPSPDGAPVAPAPDADGDRLAAPTSAARARKRRPRHVATARRRLAAAPSRPADSAHPPAGRSDALAPEERDPDSERDTPAGLALPVVAAPRPERCDARRNRRRILEAAERLIAEDGVAGVSLEQIAAAAGVGKGTVFRRFGDRAGLLRELLQVREASFQEAFIRGPAPLGPGCDPRQRLLAFGPAMIDVVTDHLELLRAAEGAEQEARFVGSVHAAHRLHVVLLLEQAGASGDPEFLADVLLAPLSAGLTSYFLEDRGFDRDWLAEQWCALVERILP